MKEIFLEKEFEYKGFKCMVFLTVMGHRCGYVDVKGTSLDGKDMFENECEDIYVHGGITWSGTSSRFKNDDWWIGWDYAHCGDGKDIDAVKEAFKDDIESLGYIMTMQEMNNIFLSNHLEYVATTEDVEKDCMRVVDQIIELENKKKEEEK